MHDVAGCEFHLEVMGREIQYRISCASCLWTSFEVEVFCTVIHSFRAIWSWGFYVLPLRICVVYGGLFLVSVCTRLSRSLIDILRKLRNQSYLLLVYDILFHAHIRMI